MPEIKPKICLISADYLVVQKFELFFKKLKYDFSSLFLSSKKPLDKFPKEPSVLFIYVSHKLTKFNQELPNILKLYANIPIVVLKSCQAPLIDRQLKNSKIKGVINLPVKFMHLEEKIVTMLQQDKHLSRIDKLVLIIDKTNCNSVGALSFLPEEVLNSLTNIIKTESYKNAIDMIKSNAGKLRMIIVNAENDYHTIEVARLLRIALKKNPVPVYFVAERINEYTYDNLIKLGFDNIIDKTEFNYDEIKNILVSHKRVTEINTGSSSHIGFRKHILNNIKQIKSLPPLPDIYFKIESLANDRTSTPLDFSRVIELDPGISTKMLRMINSAHYGFSRKIDNLRDAVSMMGINGIVSMVRLSCIAGSLKIDKKAEEYVVQLWRHSAICAISSQIIAKKSGIKLQKDDMDNMFTCGIIHDIGKFIFLKFFAGQYIPIMEKHTGNRILNYFEEEKYLGVTHVEIGKYLAIHWHLPDFFSQVIRMHHSPEKNQISETFSIIHVADIVSNCISSEGFLDVYMDRYSHDTSIGFDQNDIQQLVEEIGPEVDEKARAVQEMLMT